MKRLLVSLVAACLLAAAVVTTSSATAPPVRPTPNVACGGTCTGGGYYPPFACAGGWLGWRTLWNGWVWQCSNYPNWHWVQVEYIGF